MDENENILPIAVTIGEPSGIGPEVVLKAWYKRQEFAISPFFVIGNSNILRTQAEYLNLNIPIKVITEPDAAISSFKDYLPVIEIAADSEFEFKVPNANTAAMVIGAIDKAVEYIMNGEARAMATAPIHKAALYSAGFTSPGHTEYLAALTGKYTGEDYLPVMMLASEELCVVPLTIHMPISEVPAMINHKLLVRTIGTIHDAMKEYFDLPNPKIVVSGLNPHAGEENSMGNEDSEIISPAIESLKRAGIRVNGPIPADTMFHKAARAKYDVALCMYHDQALIPIKTIDFDGSVNVTLGLPIIRTSPDHGTAFDIAGTGLANPTSMINSLKLADRMSKDITSQKLQEDE